VEGFVATLLDVARDLGLAGWIARSHCFKCVVSIMRDDFAVGLPLLRGGLDELREVGATPGAAAFLTVLARGLGSAGRVSEGLAAIEQAFMLSERYEERWCLPELLRNKGGASALQGLGRCLARGGGVSPASARLGGLRRNPGVGVAGGDQPRPFAARPRAAGGGARSAGADL
jgi:hypothetical protein